MSFIVLNTCIHVIILRCKDVIFFSILILPSMIQVSLNNTFSPRSADALRSVHSTAVIMITEGSALHAVHSTAVIMITEGSALHSVHSTAVIMITEGSALRLKPRLQQLRSHKLSLWPPCGMHDNLNLISVFKRT